MADESLPEKPPAHEGSVPPRGKGRRKQEGILPTRRIKGKVLLKPSPVKGEKKRTTGGRGTEQVGLRTSTQTPDQYVRFRVRVDDGKVSIVDSHLVEGSLVTPATLSGNFAYEVTHAQRRLHADSIPDLGVTRSFANPEGPPEQRAHNVTELSSYEFNIRVPANELTREALPNIAIALYRVKDRATTLMLGAMPLNIQYVREVRELAHMDGISPRILPEAMQKSRSRRARGSKRD
jgi:hypothetical protein